MNERQGLVYLTIDALLQQVEVEGMLAPQREESMGIPGTRFYYPWHKEDTTSRLDIVEEAIGVIEVGAQFARPSIYSLYTCIKAIRADQNQGGSLASPNHASPDSTTKLNLLEARLKAALELQHS